LQGEFNFGAVYVYAYVRENETELKLFSTGFSIWKLPVQF